MIAAKPFEYDLTNNSPEKYVAIAVGDLIQHTDKEKLHLNGDISAEYLGMLALYALRRSKQLFPKGERFSELVALSYDNFDPFHMSDELVECLTDMILEAKGEA